MNQIDPSQKVDDFLNAPLGPTAIPTNDSGEADPNIWKPKLKGDVTNYNAMVRLLPQGVEGVKNNSYPSVMVAMHYLKDKTTGVTRTVKCRRTFGEKVNCPICNNIWGRWRAIKDQTGSKDQANAAMLPLTSTKVWYTNVLIIQDDVNPNNNNTVKVWSHSDSMEKKLMDPMTPDADANKPGQQGTLKKQSKRTFVPYCHRNGVNFVVMAAYGEKKINGRQMVSYDGSYWLDQSTPLANSNEEILAILDQCHDLSKYLEDVPSEEQATQAVNEFWAEVDKKLAEGQTNTPVSNGTLAAQQSFVAPQYQAPSAPAAIQPNVQATISGAQFFGAQTAPQPSFTAPQYQASVTPQAAGFDDGLATAMAARSTAPAAAPVAPAAPANLAEPVGMPEDDDGELPF